MKFYTRPRRMPQVIIVSLIDIFAILLIFVIVSTTFKKEEKAMPAVTIKLPEASHAVAAEATEPPVILTVSAEEQFFLDDKQVTEQELQKALAEMVQAKVQQKLALNADTKAPFGTVIRVLDILREAGVKGNLAAFMEKKQ